MKNNEKVDIDLSSDISVQDLSLEEKAQLEYETAMRYINIAEHMKQFEDQNKYYHRAIVILKRINDNGQFSSMIKELNLKRFDVRAMGKVHLYEEACHIRDNAKSPQDYYSAQTLFMRIHNYPPNHAFNEENRRFIKPDLFEKAVAYNDAKEQADQCEKMAHALEAREKRQSLFASIIVIAAIAALLVFSRTTQFHQVLGTAYHLFGDDLDAYQQYHSVYERSGSQDAYDKYLETRYAYALSALESENPMDSYDHFKALAEDDYEDSRHQFFLLEQENLKKGELGEIVHFSSIDWRVLEIQDDRILLMKDHAIASTPFNTTSGPCTWETSSARAWLNSAFLTENFYEDELNAILDTNVVTEANSAYPGVDPGNATTDKAFLLSEQELQKYFDQLHPTETCWWLRTPGAYEGSMSFVYRNKELMSYGYEVTSQEMTIKPAMWVSLK